LLDNDRSVEILHIFGLFQSGGKLLEGSGSVKPSALFPTRSIAFALSQIGPVRYIGGMQPRVEHLGLPARDPAALKDWYVRVLGAELVFDNDQTPPAYFIRLAGGLMLEIYEGDFALKETADNKLNGFRHLALRVESIEEAKKALSALGVVFPELPKPAGGGGRVLFFSDPEGNLLHFVERPVGTVFG
jgi:glyoxylase I family protein